MNRVWGPNSRAYRRSSLQPCRPSTASGPLRTRVRAAAGNRAMTEHLCVSLRCLGFWKRIKSYRKLRWPRLPVLPRMVQSWCYQGYNRKDSSLLTTMPLCASSWEGLSSALQSQQKTRNPGPQEGAGWGWGLAPHYLTRCQKLCLCLLRQTSRRFFPGESIELLGRSMYTSWQWRSPLGKTQSFPSEFELLFHTYEQSCVWETKANIHRQKRGTPRKQTRRRETVRLLLIKIRREILQLWNRRSPKYVGNWKITAEMKASEEHSGDEIEEIS